jgi:hypothetical protein
MNAQTGDLLIFRSIGTVQSIQRKLTGSDYGMIILYIYKIRSYCNVFEIG